MIPVGEARPTPMSTTEAGRKGGSAVRDKYGEDYYRRIGKKGGSVLKEKRGTEYYRTIAKKGGNANMAKKAEKLRKSAWVQTSTVASGKRE